MEMLPAARSARLCIFCLLLAATLAPAQTSQTGAAATPATSSSTKPAPATPTPAARPRRVEAPPPPVTRADVLRGAYGPYRANNDLLSYHLDIRVDPAKQTIGGKNTIRFRMLADGDRIQLDLHEALKIDKIVLGATELKYTRDSGAVFVDFPETLKQGQIYSIDFYYSGHPVTMGRFGGFTFSKDPDGKPWIFTSCEDEGASIWWPNKDQWRDEVESMEISVAVPNDLVDVSNGRFVSKTDLGDGYTRWDWMVHYPINNYDVALNIGNYQHFSDTLKGDKTGDLTMDYYVLPGDLEKARKQFTQARGMMEAFQHYFGPYPFAEDGYKLVQVPYAGMEHQSAVAYGNHFQNSYLGPDWTGVGISPRFDFIIIHESGHEWFGNSVSAADRSDMWIHEGWTTYLETLYVEYMYGHDDAIKYLTGVRKKVQNQRPIIAERGVNADPTEDQYFKGALMINTLRSVIGDDSKWWPLIYDFYQQFKYRNIMTEDVVAFFNRETGLELTPIFNQYLRHADIPTLQLFFDAGSVSYKWRADEPGFTMPVLVGEKGHWQRITPTEQWQTIKTSLTKEQFEVATDLFYVDVAKY
jgi:aminopeptidase N